MTRLKVLCILFGWKGGTIFQANEECSKRLNRPVNVLSLTSNEWYNLLEELVTKEST